MEKTVSTNQASLILCIFTVALKLSALPALMFSYSGNDSYIACLIALVFDFLGTVIIVHILNKNPDKTFFGILRETMGKVVAIIVEIIMFIYFFAKCVLTLQELHDYFIATLFEELDPAFFIIVLALLLMYSMSKNFRTIGRVIQLIFWPTLLAITFTLIFPIKDIQVEKLLPIFEQGFRPIFTSLSRTTFAFGDYMILLPLMGHVTVTPKSKKQMLMYMLGALQFIFTFFFVFVGSFGKFSTSQTLALGELPLHNSTPETIGKLEWLVIIIWTVILVINSMILAMACRNCFDNIFGTHDKNIAPIVIGVAFAIAITLLYLQLTTVLKIAVSPTFALIAGLIQVMLIVLLVIAHYIKNKPKKQKNRRREKYAKYAQ